MIRRRSLTVGRSGVDSEGSGVLVEEDDVDVVLVGVADRRGRHPYSWPYAPQSRFSTR